MIEKIRDLVLEQSRQGNLVVQDFEGGRAIPIDSFIKQPIEGILYDLNRLPEVILTFIDDPKWVNDYAVMLTIKALKGRVERLEEALKAVRSGIANDELASGDSEWKAVMELLDAALNPQASLD